MKRAVIAGASGLIGSELLKLLLANDDIAEVVALVRGPLSFENKKLKQVHVEFDTLDRFKDDVKGDVVYCCLGTTKRKTPDEEEYRKIDYKYPLELARIAATNNSGQFHLISALGANAASNVFYTKLKGELEQEIKRVGLRSLHIYQPSLLTGNRTEKRPLEKIAIILMTLVNPILLGPFKKYRSIPASLVARAMLNQTFKNLTGIHTYPSDHIKELA